MTDKRIAVLGLGQFGGALARELSTLGVEVLAVDRDPEQVQLIRNDVSVAAVADVRDRDALAELTSEPFDIAIVATGGSLEAAILATLHLKELEVPQVWVEAPNDDGAEVLRRVGADKVFSPEREAGRRLAQQLANPNMIEFLPITKGYGICEVDAPMFMHHKTLEELDLRNTKGVAVIAIRGKESATLVPTAATRIEPGDVLSVVGRDEDLANLRGQ